MRAAYLDSSNTLGHLTGAILTSLPLGKGGWSPYEVRTFWCMHALSSSRACA